MLRQREEDGRLHGLSNRKHSHGVSEAGFLRAAGQLQAFLLRGVAGYALSASLQISFLL